MTRNFIVLAIAGWAIASQAWGQECALTIEGNDQIQFNQKEMRVSKRAARR